MNLQQIEKRIERADGALDIVDVFPTIQGEGPFVGRPCVFVRLAGCNLQCPLCDTDYTSNRRLVPADQLLEQVDKARPAGSYLIVITGGEPFRQACGRFVKAAIEKQYAVQFESNGTVHDLSMELGCWYRTSIVCSPKTGQINGRLAPYVTSYKYVITAGKVDPVDGLPLDSLGSGVRVARPHDGFRGTVYAQPCDDRDPVKNAANTQAAIDSCMKFGYTLCVQVHKIIGLP